MKHYPLGSFPSMINAPDDINYQQSTSERAISSAQLRVMSLGLPASFYEACLSSSDLKSIEDEKRRQWSHK